MKEALDIEVHGIVQGVGFRPFIYKIARRHLINGWVPTPPRVYSSTLKANPKTSTISSWKSLTTRLRRPASMKS